MSDFVQQQNSICDFGSSDSWVVLSPIEQSIKKKIEAVGTPLRDWNINIYRGVLTGCNEAFIINTEKRDEILANCQTDDERTRTAELIRPFSSLTPPVMREPFIFDSNEIEANDTGLPSSSIINPIKASSESLAIQ